ncbi:MAG TPA: CoA pyrophosphatase [Longimicrobium sp.]|nr:CoA pyrophosphatase [Longimicrobium sp.]
MRPDHPGIAKVAEALAALPPVQVPDDSAGLSRAAVALLLRPAGRDLELLLIRRAEREGDPWSGHMALPGGRAQAEDAGPAATAARETREEVGIDPLDGGALLGGLEPLWPRSGRAPRLLVHPFVFSVPADAEPTPNHEVDAALWIPVSELLHPGAVTEHLYEIEGADPLRFPALGTRGYVIWGLTHRILSDFLALYAGGAGGQG